MSDGTTTTSTELITEDKNLDEKGRGKMTESTEDKEFDNMIDKGLPRWNTIWKFLLQNSNNNRHRRENKMTGRTRDRSARGSFEKGDQDFLQRKIQNKIAELVKEEEALVKLYLKAADIAREREEEFKSKTNVLIGQIEKDKHFMKMIKNVT